MIYTDFSSVQRFFDRYTREFVNDTPDNHAYVMKRAHTFRVCRNMTRLAEGLDLDDRTAFLAGVAALLHDLGRFRQFRDFHTFYDPDSVNHALLGAEEIRAHNVLDFLDTADRETVLSAVAFHNVYQLPDILDPATRFLTRLVRDADKLDILRVMTRRYRKAGKVKNNTYITFNLPDDGLVSETLVRKLRQKQLLDARDVKTLNDMKLLQISWVFDLNFAPAVAMANENRYMDTIFASMPRTERTKQLSLFIRDEVLRRMNADTVRPLS